MPAANWAGVSHPVSATANRSTSGSAACPPPNASAPMTRKRPNSSSICLSPIHSDPDDARGGDHDGGVHEQTGNESTQHNSTQCSVRLLGSNQAPGCRREDSDDRDL